MRLLTRTTLNLLSISLFVYLFGVIAFYYSLRLQVDQNVNQEMLRRKGTLLRQMQEAHNSSAQKPGRNEIVVITPVEKPTLHDNYRDTLLFDKEENRYHLYRQLGFTETINDQSYEIRIFKSLEETDTLIIQIIATMTGLVILLIITLLIVNRYSSRLVWGAFYDTLDKVNSYDLNSHEDFSLQESDIQEFTDLNNVLHKMTDRIRDDYFNLKEYTENASHEIQTPLAIIHSKLELLLQSGELNEKQYKALADAYEASVRLAKYNKTLILLAKIENKQFPEEREVVLSEIADNLLESLEDLIRARELQVERYFAAGVKVKMNPYLAEMLVVNLVKNAIRHNVRGGKLILEVTNRNLRISNTGSAGALDGAELFKRFHTSSKSPESLGLGLAIVSKICLLYHFEIHYNYQEGLHCMQVDFKGREKG
ncbi:MAG: HAMP domain-containing histidine kinase [Marinilabiliales bacterium]|nr:HAMP domain-containing histidine kinase [Marinilabiliales bacterium]